MEPFDNNESQKFTRRSFLIGAGQFIGLAGLGARLGWLQIVNGEQYKTLADKNRINLRIIPPRRGQIMDLRGLPLASNKQKYQVFIVPEQADDINGVLNSLARLIDLPDNAIETVKRSIKEKPSYFPIKVKDNLTRQELAIIEVNIPDLAGIMTDVGYFRNYTLGEASAHLIGYVGEVTKADLTKEPALNIPGFKIGKTGIEKAYDPLLRGKAGRAEVEVNVIGREIRELNKESPENGENIQLSVDLDLQAYVFERLTHSISASAVVLDAHNGAIYALASCPSFDPRKFSQGITTAEWEKLLSHPDDPLTNKALAGQYPPGSTFKMITALAALKKGIVGPDNTFFCPGFFRMGRDRFHCWRKEGHGHMNLFKAIEESCDVYFYNLATQLTIDDIAEVARDFGLGSRTGFELAEGRPGLVPDKEWKFGHFGERWAPGETVVSSIGQGYLLTTPLQLGLMTAALVNGGKKVTPWATLRNGLDLQAFQNQHPKVNVSAHHLDLVKYGMDLAVIGERGTARGSKLEDPSMQMGGKTGTAQVKRITTAERLAGIKNEDLPRKFRHHALFVGYAPLHKPRFVCSVVVEHGGSGSKSAAPIARDILKRTQEIDPAGKLEASFTGARQSGGHMEDRKTEKG